MSPFTWLLYGGAVRGKLYLNSSLVSSHLPLARKLQYLLCTWLNLVIKLVIGLNPINDFYLFIHVGHIFVIQIVWFFFIELINIKMFKLIILNLYKFWVICEKCSKVFTQKLQPIDFFFSNLFGPQFMTQTAQYSHINKKNQNI